LVKQEKKFFSLNQRHKEMLWTTVRVKSSKAWGSGTLVYSRQDKTGKWHNYVLTCHHVIADNIKVEKKWNPKVGMDVKKEVRTPVEVQFFYYENLSHARGLSGSFRAEIVSYDADQDIALLELEKNSLTEPIAYMYPYHEEDKIHVFDEIYCCGAAMAHKPITTKGIITFMDEIIDDYEYWMSSAASIFGNSGGAIFRYSKKRSHYEFLGMPARIVVNMAGFSQDAITHMGFFVPVTRIYSHLKDNHYGFIYDNKQTYEGCKKAREAAKKEAEKLFMARYGGEAKVEQKK